jgi:hypothetical protein
MNLFQFPISSRQQKKKLLLEVIETLPIKTAEKDLSIFSMDILSDEDFNTFFEKITGEIGAYTNIKFSFSPIPL